LKGLIGGFEEEGGGLVLAKDWLIRGVEEEGFVWVKEGLTEGFVVEGG
jgi:hypothetical protein